MTRFPSRHGLSLIEVLIAGVLLTLAFLPALFMFHSAATVAADDIREIRAYRLAEELVEHIVAIHLLKRVMTPVPAANEAFLDAGVELDVEDLLARYPGEEGAPFYPGGTSMLGSRLYLHPTEDGYRRFLALDYQARGRERVYVSRSHLLGVHVRVRYRVPRTIGDLYRDVTLTTYLYCDSMPPRTAEDDRAGAIR